VNVCTGKSRFCQSPNTFFAAVNDDREDRVVRGEEARVERDQVIARERGDRLRRAVLRHPVRMEAVDQPIEHGVRDVAGIFEADRLPREHLLALALDFRRRERRLPRHVGQHAEPGVEAVLHHDHVHEREIGAGAGAHRAADEVDRVVHLLRRHRLRALIEERGGEVRQPEFLPRIGGGTRAHEQAHRDRRLLVVHHHDDLQPVGQRLDLVGRELDVACRQRLRRPLGRPGDRLRGREITGTKRDHREEKATETQRHEEPSSSPCLRVSVADHALRSRGALPAHGAPAFPDGISVSTSRFSGLKYVFATRCTSATVMF
jgi:hypothetical protein